MKHIRESGESISALTLAFTVAKMMKSKNVVIAYHNYDISKKQGAGEYFVKGITIDGEHQPFAILHMLVRVVTILQNSRQPC